MAVDDKRISPVEKGYINDSIISFTFANIVINDRPKIEIFYDKNKTYFIAVQSIEVTNEIDQNEDNSTTITSNKGIENNIIQVTRTLSKDYWNTFCLPFNVDKDSVKLYLNDPELREFTGKVDGTTMLFKDATEIKAGIPKEFIGAIIGPGGKIIQQMQEETGATITIEETEGVGKVQVSAPNKDAIDAALGKIKAIVAVPEIGEVYEGTVRSIMPYGCFVEILPGKDGLLHISEIDWKRLETVEEAGIKEGDKIKVKLLDIDPKTGKYKLSRRVLLEKPEGYVEPQRRPRGERRPRRDGEQRHDERRPRHENNNNESND